MSSQVAQEELSIKLLWIWISLLISMFVFWRLRHLWLKCHPPLDVRTKYSRRLSKRLKDRQAMRLSVHTDGRWSKAVGLAHNYMGYF